MSGSPSLSRGLIPLSRPEQAQTDVSTSRRLSGANAVAAGIFLSRIAGIVRTVVLGAVVGTGTALDAFGFAMRLPNLLQNLLGEGSLSASFIPVYAKLVEDGEEERAGRVAGTVLTLLVLVTGLIVLVAVLAAGPIITLATSWEGDPERFDLAVQLFRITTVGIGFLVISAWCLGVLNSHRRFFLSYVSPVAWNSAQITVLVLAAVLMWTDLDTVVALAWAVVAGGVLQTAVQLKTTRSLLPALRLGIDRGGDVSDVLRRFVPAVGARGVIQFSSVVDQFLLAAVVVKAVGLYVLALPLYITPISLFGFSVAASELAEMSRRSDSLDALADRLTPALRRVLIPAGFITVAYLAAAPIFVDALYGWPSRLIGKAIPAADILVLGYLLMAMAIGLPAAMTARVTQNTLYSIGDVKGPARIAVIRVLVSAVVSVTLMLQLDWLTFDDTTIVQFGDVPHWPPFERVPEGRRLQAGANPQIPHLGVVGLGLGSAVAAWLEWGLLRVRLRAELGRQAAQAVSSGWMRQIMVAAVAAGLAMVLARLVPLPSPIDAVLIAVVGVGTYAGFLWIQGVRSLSALASRP